MLFKKEIAFLVVVLLVIATFAEAVDYHWGVTSGDWSTAANWGGTEPANNDNGYIVNGGTATVNSAGEACKYLYVGGASAGTVKMSAGGFSAFSAYVGNSGVGTFTHSAGTNALTSSLYVGNNAGSNGVYTLKGTAQLSSTLQRIGNNGIGKLDHTAGSNTVSSTLYLAYNTVAGVSYSGTYNLSGSGQVSAVSEYIGYNGKGIFNHSAGTNTTTNLYFGYNSSANGTYKLSGTGQLAATNENIGTNSNVDNGATALLDQTGGTNTADHVTIYKAGTYKLTSGTLQINVGLDNRGVMDFNNGMGMLNAVNAIVNFGSPGKAPINTSSATMTIGENSLLIVPAGYNPDPAFQHRYSNAGILHTYGTTLTVPAGKNIFGSGTIDDVVECLGTISAAANGFIHLNNGLTVSGAGSVNLGTGNLQSNTTSGMDGGSLSAACQYIGNTSNGSFNQTGGTNTATSSLYLGYSTGVTGNYSLSDGQLLTASEYIGYVNSGTFSQTGGTNTVTNLLTLGSQTAGSGTYSLTGGRLILKSLSKGPGTATFNFGGGTLQASGNFSSALPMNLSGTNGNANLDTAGFNVTLSGILSGVGGLTKVGNGTLTLSGVNIFTGSVNFNGGLIKVTALNNLANGTALNFNGGGLQFNGIFDPSLRMMTFQSGTAKLDTQANNITLSKSIGNSGNGGLTKQGTGTLILFVSPSYKGATVVGGGTLQLGTDGSGVILPSTTSVNLSASGATLDISSNSQTIVSLSGVAGSEVKLGGGILTVGDSTSTTFDGVISGSTGGSLTKTGLGTLNLTGINTYTGNTVISGGVLGIKNVASLPGYDTSGKVIINNGGALSIWAGAPSGQWTAAEINTLQNNAVFNTNSFLAIDTTDGDFTYGGALRGNLSLAKLGNNTLIMTNAYTYTGKTIIDAGMLVASKAASLPGYNIAGKVTVDPDATLAVRAGASSGEWIASEIDALRTNTTFSTGAYLGIDTSSGNFSYASVVGGSLGLIKMGANTLTLSGANTFTGRLIFENGFVKAVTLNNLGTGTMLDFNGGGLQFDGVFDPSVRAITILTGGAIFDTQANTIALENAIGDGGAGGLTKKGSGVLTLSAAPNYNGTTTVNGGTLKIAGGIDAAQMSVIDVLSGTASLNTTNVNKSSLNITTSSSATFEVEDGTHLVGSITGNGITQVDSGAILIAKLINQSILRIGSGAKITIQPLGGGPLSGSSLMVPEPSSLVLLVGALIAAGFLSLYARCR